MSQTINALEIVSQDPDVLSGTAVFVGTRVPVQNLIDHIKAGDSLDEFLVGFPSVRRDQAEAFLEFAFHSALTEVEHARAA